MECCSCSDLADTIPSNSCNVRGECCSTPSPTVSPTPAPTREPTPRPTSAPTTARPTHSPTSRPTRRPTTLSPTRDPRDVAYSELYTFARTITYAGHLRPYSAQYYALEWLVDDRVENGNIWTGYELIQRYVIAVFFFATRGKRGVNYPGLWNHDPLFFQSTPICSWGSPDLKCTGQDIYEIDISNRGLLGSIPSELRALTKLTRLLLNSNELTGTLPTQLGEMTSLTLLHSKQNPLSGSIPTELGLLTDLTWLSLYGNQFSGQIPSELGHLTEMTYLAVTGNELTGTIPTELAQATQLRRLFLGENDFVGSVPTELCSAPFVSSWAAFYADCWYVGGTRKNPCDCCTHCCNIYGGCFPN